VNTRGTTGAAQQQQGSISQASAASGCCGIFVNTRGTTGAAQQQQGSISQASAASGCSTTIFFIYIYISPKWGI